MRLSNQLSCRLCRFTFALFLAWIWAGGTNLARAQDAPGDKPADAAAEVERLDRHFKAIEAAGKDIPRDTFDFAAVVKAVGSEPGKLAAWVKGQTAWVPYRGCLRGPLGTLMDRRGNSLDRATLLAELLRTAGRTVRLARADLPDAAVADVRKGLTFVPPKTAQAPPMDRGAIDQIIIKYAKPNHLDPAAIKRAGEELLTRNERLTEDLLGRSVEQSAMLSKLMWPDAPAAADAADDADLVAALRDHWWVQYQDGGAWTDADPLLAAPLKPAETIDWQPKDGVWPLEAKRCHEIVVRVVVEKWAGGKLIEQPVLTHTLRPSQLIGTYIELRHVPQNWPEVDFSKEENPGAKVRELALAQKQWLPMLRVGKDAITQASFSDAGAVDPKPDVFAFKQASKAVGGAAGQAAGLLDVDAPAPQPGHLTAEWIEYDIRVPGSKPRVIRRQLFDLMGPGARIPNAQVVEPFFDETARAARALSLLGQTEILPLACQLSPDYVQDLTTRTTLGLRQPLVTSISGGTAEADKQALELLNKLPPVPSRLYALAQVRVERNPQGELVYLDRPNILSLHQFLRDDGAAGAKYCIGIDIVANDVAVVPGVDAGKARQARLMQGVVDTNAESLLMDPAAKIANIADRLANSGDPAAWLLVQHADDAAWKQLNIPAEYRLRVDAELAQGYAVLVEKTTPPEAEVERGWYRIDPRTGMSLGISERTWGQTVAEYQMVLGSIFFMACMVGGAAVGKGGPGTKSGTRSAVACAFAAIGFAALAPASWSVTVVGASMVGGLGAGMN